MWHLQDQIAPWTQVHLNARATLAYSHPLRVQHQTPTIILSLHLPIPDFVSCQTLPSPASMSHLSFSHKPPSSQPHFPPRASRPSPDLRTNPNDRCPDRQCHPLVGRSFQGPPACFLHNVQMPHACPLQSLVFQLASPLSIFSLPPGILTHPSSQEGAHIGVTTRPSLGQKQNLPRVVRAHVSAQGKLGQEPPCKDQSKPQGGSVGQQQLLEGPVCPRVTGSGGWNLTG